MISDSRGSRYLPTTNTIPEAMEFWFIILITLSISLLLSRLLSKSAPRGLPPSPTTVPLIGSIFLLRRLGELEPIIKSLFAKLGPVVSLQIGSRRAIFVADRSLAHQALVQNGAFFADRPPAGPLGKILSCDQHNISSAGYGPTWRLLRRNLTLEILHPSRVKSYSHARKWVLEILFDRLNSQAKTGGPIQVLDHFQYSMFCLLVLMCFGDKLDQEKIKEIEEVQRRLLLGFASFNVLNFWHRITKIIYRTRWNAFLKCREDQGKVLIPLIRARKRAKEEKSKDVNNYVVAYVDTLLDLDLPDQKRNLKEEEIVSLCSEFLNAGTDTTSTALQWIMANLVKYPEIQEKLFEEMKSVVGESEEVKEEDLGRIPYLKAVVLEALRRHPPGHFVLPHTVTEETQLGGYQVPMEASVNFAVAEMGWDPKVWEAPMEFRPERFEKGGEGFEVDITGSREIKMMPFGVGRRICPGLGLALLHLEYFVANLVWKFRWERVAGDEVSVEEKLEFTVVMKVPLKSNISPRS